MLFDFSPLMVVLLDWVSEFLLRTSSPDSVFAVLNPVKHILSFQLGTLDGEPITVGKIIFSILFLAAGIYISKFFLRIISNKLLEKFVDSKAAVHAIENISFYLMVAFFSIAALQVANIPVTVFNFIGGAIALAAGLGSQNIMNNFMSGLILLMERPVKIGDIVFVDDVYGRVEDIGMRATKITSFDNKHLIVPNSKVLEGNVSNWTYNSKRVRSRIKVGVRYGSSVDQVKKCLVEAAKENPATLKSREPIVIFENFGDSSLEFELYIEIKVLDLFDERRILSSIREGIVEKFASKEIVIAFPQRDVHVHMPEDAKELFKRAS